MSDNTKNRHVEHAESRGMQQFWYAWNADIPVCVRTLLVLGSMTCARAWRGGGGGRGVVVSRGLTRHGHPLTQGSIMNLYIRPWFPQYFELVVGMCTVCMSVETVKAMYSHAPS